MTGPDDASGSTPGSGGSRRANGLVAATYLPLADLDPRVADAMLRLLHAEGIAAYASPTPGRVGGYLDVTPPSRPTDRLFVDMAQARRARAVVQRVIRESGGGPRDGSAAATDRPEAVGSGGGATGDIDTGSDAFGGTGNDAGSNVGAGTGNSHAGIPDEERPARPDLPRDRPITADQADPAAAVDSATRGIAGTGGTDRGASSRDDRAQAGDPPPDQGRAGTPVGATAEDHEAIWQALVATFAVPSPSRAEGVPWPAAEDLATEPTAPPVRPARAPDPPTLDGPPSDRPQPDGPPLDGRHRAATGPAGPATTPAEPPGGHAQLSRPAGQPSGPDPLDEEHFVPPAPPPVPRPAGATGWGVVSLVGGAGVLVVPAMAGHPVSAWIGFLAVLAVIGGFVTLVARMRDAPPTDSGPDDGAVV